MPQIYYESKVPKRQRFHERPRTKSDIFRTNLYKFGKASGTLRSIPGIAGSNFSQTLANARNKAYPIARYLGNFQAFQNRGEKGMQSFLAQGIQRGGRIVSGMISGRAIDMIVRPFGDFGLGRGLGQLASRQFRIQLGKRLQGGRNPVDKAINKMTKRLSVTATAKVNGRKVNEKVRANKEIARVAQKVLSKAFLNAQAFAPDVSSGQFVVGGKGLKRNTNLLNQALMTDVENFNKRGIAYRDEATGRKYYRDVFGFTKPGQARSFLVNSIEMMPVRPTKGQNVKTFFRGEVSAGGSARDFPWIWAVEYGGDIPVMYPAKMKGYNRKGRGRRRGSRNALNFDENGNPIFGERLRDLSPAERRRAVKDFRMQYAEDDAVVPRNHYIKPSFFMHRSATKAAEFARGLAEVNIVKVDSPSAKYYQAWLRNAKSKQYKNQGIQRMNQKTLPYARIQAMAGKFAMREIYQQKRGAGSNMRSQMEQAIPGPRVDVAHGGFYSKELQEAIGIQYAPDDFVFSFSFPIKTTDTGTVLKAALDEYIKSGGFTTAYREGPVVENIVKRLGNTYGRRRASTEELRADAQRYVNLFYQYEKAKANTVDINQINRNREYLEKVFDLKFDITPGNRRARVSLKEKNRKARKQASMDRQKAANRKRQELGERIFSDLDLRDILDEIGG